MKIILFGATGMVGEAALIEALDDPRVERVLSVGRRTTGRSHPKLEELLHRDFLDFSPVESAFAGYDACLYCVGVTSAGMSEDDYHRVTVDFTVAAAEAMLRQSPALRMCFISGQGTDPDSKTMWARVKGAAEQALMTMPWRSAHMFRPGWIQPRKGVSSRVRSYRIMYGLLGWTYPVFKRMAPKSLMTSDDLGRALLQVAAEGHPLSILEAADINAVVGE